MREDEISYGFHRAIGALITALGAFGGWIVNHPNKIFYFILLLACFFFPYFAVFLILSLLCWARGRYYAQW